MTYKHVDIYIYIYTPYVHHIFKMIFLHIPPFSWENILHWNKAYTSKEYKQRIGQGQNQFNKLHSIFYTVHKKDILYCAWSL